MISGRSSGSSWLSIAASNSIMCGFVQVAGDFQSTFKTVNTEYGTNRNSDSPGIFVFST